MIMATITLQNLDAAGKSVGEPRSKKFMASVAAFNRQGTVSVDDLICDESNLKDLGGRKTVEAFLDLAATLGVELPLTEMSRLRVREAPRPMSAEEREAKFGLSAALAREETDRQRGDAA